MHTLFVSTPDDALTIQVFQAQIVLYCIVFDSIMCQDIDESDKEVTRPDRRTDGIKFLHNFPCLGGGDVDWRCLKIYNNRRDGERAEKTTGNIF